MKKRTLVTQSLVITEDLGRKCGFMNLEEEYKNLRRSLSWPVLEGELRDICARHKLSYEKCGAVKDITRKREVEKLMKVKMDQHLTCGFTFTIGRIKDVTYKDKEIKVTWIETTETESKTAPRDLLAQVGYHTGIYFCKTTLGSPGKERFGTITNGIKLVFH
jgi:hypothetical protein